MRKNEIRENGMRKRQVGNYLKEYPHVYEVLRKEIFLKNITFGCLICSSVVVVFMGFSIALLEMLAGGDFMFVCMVDAMLLALPGICIFVLLEESRRSGMISLEELELMEKDLAGEKEKVGNWGYSMKESFIIGFYRIPRKGLNAVYQGTPTHGGRNGVKKYELEFWYEDGTHLSAWLRGYPVSLDEKSFARLIRRYDDSVRIYRYQKMHPYMHSYRMSYPFERLKVEVPFVRKEVMDELNTLCSGNSFWKLAAKSENEYNDNKEVELTLRGTALTWLLYIVGICLWVCIFLFFYYTPLQPEAMRAMVLGYSEGGVLFWLLVPFLALCVAELCWYLCFFKNARKITEKAITILYKGTI